jgi:hypothetical protein
MTRPTRSLRLPALLLSLALLGAACGDDDDATAGPGTTAPEPGGTTTTAAPTEGPTTSQPPTTSPATTPTTGPSAVEDRAEGAGCTPDGDDLTDGRWFGFVSAPTGSGFEFDLACWFTGDAAAEAAAEDGEESPPPNDYYVRNANPRLRSLTLASPDVPVTWTEQAGDPGSEVETPYGEWLDARRDQMAFGVWVEVRDGEVERIAEQWVP